MCSDFESFTTEKLLTKTWNTRHFLTRMTFECRLIVFLTLLVLIMGTYLGFRPRHRYNKTILRLHRTLLVLGRLLFENPVRSIIDLQALVKATNVFNF